MPTYVYKFVDSGETIEVQQAFSDPTLTELAHPDDGTVRPVKKVFLPVGITFKGSGFYKTDNRNGKSSSTSKANGESSSSDSASTASSSGTSTAASSSDSSSSPAGASSSGASSSGPAAASSGASGAAG